MFKAKKSLYLLFPLVVIIWGLLIYKVVGAISAEPKPVESVVLPSTRNIERVKTDTFSLNPLNRDPFLGHLYRKPKPKLTKNPVPKQIEWPAIEYSGLISATGKKSKIHILRVNGKEFLIEEGKVAAEIKVLNSEDSAVILQYKGDRKKYSKTDAF